LNTRHMLPTINRNHPSDFCPNLHLQTSLLGTAISESFNDRSATQKRLTAKVNEIRNHTVITPRFTWLRHMLLNTRTTHASLARGD